MLHRQLLKQIILVGAAAYLLSATGASAATISGAGSTFVQPIMAKWAEDYERSGKGNINYQSVGSGAGIKAIETGVVDFGATDKPLESAELAQYGLIQFPVVVGAVVPVFNVPDVPNGKLRFSGQILADIYLKKITRWDDDKIRSLNPKLKLPSLPITVVHRSDGSGTTYNWTDFLSKSSKEWHDHIGIGLSVSWPTGIEGKGNPGVADSVQRTSGAIGYVEYAYALQRKMTYGQVENPYRLAISPTPEAIEAAAATVDWGRSENFSVLMTDLGGPSAYPIAATTFILMSKKPKDRNQSQATLSFFRWALENGDKQAASLNFVALPDNLIAQIETYWAKQLPPVRSSER